MSHFLCCIHIMVNSHNKSSGLGTKFFSPCWKMLGRNSEIFRYFQFMNGNKFKNTTDYLHDKIITVFHSSSLPCKYTNKIWQKTQHRCNIRHPSSPFASEVWGPQTWSACSLWHPHWHHQPGVRAWSSCWYHLIEVGMVWRAPIGRWHPSSSCRWWNCCN